MSKSTLVIGASTNPERYSYKAIKMLQEYQHEIYAYALKEGMVDNIKISADKKYVKELDTVTLYVNPEIQKDLYTYILSLHPRRIIFNPGTENQELSQLANAHGIETIEACTLVMLRTNQF